MKVGIQLLLFDSGTEVVEAVGLKFAYPERIVPGFAVVDSKDFADSRSFVAAAVVAEGPVAEHILGRVVAGMGYRTKDGLFEMDDLEFRAEMRVPPCFPVAPVIRRRRVMVVLG